MSIALYMQVDGIQGECKVKGFENWIQLTSFSFAGSQGTSVGVGTGLGAGKVNLGPLEVAMVPDTACTMLFQSLCSGKHIKTVLMSMVKAGSSTPYLKVTLTDVVLTTWALGADDRSDDLPTESMSLSYAQIAFEYFRQNPDGSLVSAGKRGWDVLTNKAI
jgi:type VI secretion system secreted protein Hcp